MTRLTNPDSQTDMGTRLEHIVDEDQGSSDREVREGDTISECRKCNCGIIL